MKDLENCLEEIKYIGMRIGYFRKLRNMTQRQLADKVSINKNYLSHIECGAANKIVSLPVLIKIAKALDIELSVLVDLDDLTNSRKKINECVEEMKRTFDDLKQINAELDKIMADMDKFDS